MTVEPLVLVTILGLLCTLVAGVWGLIRYFDGKIEVEQRTATANLRAVELAAEAKVLALKTEIETKVSRLETKVEDMRDDFARKSDTDRIETAVVQLRGEIMALMRRDHQSA